MENRRREIEDIFNSLLKNYEKMILEQAKAVASELSGQDRVRAFKSYIYYMYRLVETTQAFREAKQYFDYEATAAGISAVEIENELLRNDIFEEIIIRAALRSIAVLAKELRVIDKYKINWHILHTRFVEAAEIGYRRFIETQLEVAHIYA